MSTLLQTEQVQTIVIGAGQAGLSVGHHLARRGIPFVILDANERVGDSWRQRWDSLRLFTPARFDGLDGMPFPAPAGTFITKDQMGDYLEAYAKRFDLPVRSGVRVDRLSRSGDGYIVKAGDRYFEARQVVVAMANYQRPRVPGFAGDLDPEIVRFHSLDYRGPSQLRSGPVLIVGAANSGAEIALEVVRSHPTWLSGRHPGNVPFRIESRIGRTVLAPLVLRGLFHRVLTVDTPMGRKVRPRVIKRGTPLIRSRPADLEAAGVERVGRTDGVREGKPVLEDGRVLDAANVIWCTGFDPGLSWIDLPIFDDAGEPKHHGGVVEQAAGLFFVGLHFLYAMSSTMIHGVGRDADRIAGAVAVRVANSSPMALASAATRSQLK